MRAVAAAAGRGGHHLQDDQYQQYPNGVGNSEDRRHKGDVYVHIYRLLIYIHMYIYNIYIYPSNIYGSIRMYILYIYIYSISPGRVKLTKMLQNFGQILRFFPGIYLAISHNFPVFRHSQLGSPQRIGSA